jgi:MOSC domain-containing protein
VLEVPVVPGPAPLDVRSFAACLASILELDPATAPAPRRGDTGRAWREWLAGRGLGLAPVAAPQRFEWPGPWIARLGAADGSRPAVVMFGVPSGIVWDPLARPGAVNEPRVEGCVIAALDPVEAVGRPLPAPEAPDDAIGGRVRAILVAPRAEAPMAVVDEAGALAGRGLRGDRYEQGAGTFSAWDGRGRDLTLVEGEVLDELGIEAVDARRNLVTEGVRLDDLVGRRFSVGEVQCAGARRCEPCAHLERLAGPGILRALVHRGGLRADVLGPGTVRPGDAIVAEPHSS